MSLEVYKALASLIILPEACEDAIVLMVFSQKTDILLKYLSDQHPHEDITPYMWNLHKISISIQNLKGCSIGATVSMNRSTEDWMFAKYEVKDISYNQSRKTSLLLQGRAQNVEISFKGSCCHDQ